MDRKKFYSSLRKRDSGLFGTRLSQTQVTGMDGILDAFVHHGDGRAKTLAYALATAYHEVGARMVPVREGFAASDGAARRAVAGREYGRPAGPYGHVYYGRGHVQLTWERNYRETGEKLGVDLVREPDRMLEPVLSARVLIEGLIDGRWNAHGLGIAHYLPDDGPNDLKNARRTVNITDRWRTIAGHYRAFKAAIDAAGGVPSEVAGTAPDEMPADTQEGDRSPPVNPLEALLAAVSQLSRRPEWLEPTTTDGAAGRELADLLRKITVLAEQAVAVGDIDRAAAEQQLKDAREDLADAKDEHQRGQAERQIAVAEAMMAAASA